MKKKFSQMVIAFYLLLTPFITWAQDKEVEARIHYANAESFYSKNTIEDFDKCIAELEETEKLLNATNPKILFMKIKAMYKRHYEFYAHDIDTSLKRIFMLIDKNSYPSEKYSELINIKTEFEKNQSNNSDAFKRFKSPSFRQSSDGVHYKGFISFKMGEEQNQKIIDAINTTLKPRYDWYSVLNMGYGSPKGKERDEYLQKFEEWNKNIIKWRDKLENDNNYKYAFDLFLIADKMGDISSTYQLATLYTLGKGTKVNYSLAIELYSKASQKNHFESMNALGFIFENKYYEVEWKADYAEAALWYRKAAENGDIQGMINLLKLHLREYNRLPKKQRQDDNNLIVGLLEKAGEKNNKPAIEQLIDIYKEGIEGVNKNKEKAKYWQEKLQDL